MGPAAPNDEPGGIETLGGGMEVRGGRTSCGGQPAGVCPSEGKGVSWPPGSGGISGMVGGGIIPAPGGPGGKEPGGIIPGGIIPGGIDPCALKPGGSEVGGLKPGGSELGGIMPGGICVGGGCAGGKLGEGPGCSAPGVPG